MPKLLNEQLSEKSVSDKFIIKLQKTQKYQQKNEKIFMYSTERANISLPITYEYHPDQIYCNTGFFRVKKEKRERKKEK